MIDALTKRLSMINLLMNLLVAGLNFIAIVNFISYTVARIT